MRPMPRHPRTILDASLDARVARLRLPVAGLAALAAASFRPLRTRAQEPTELSFALDWYPNANHAGIFLAQARGYFAEAGVAPQIFTPPDPTTVLQTVGAGRDDVGISYQTDVLLARAQGIPVVSVGALAQRPLLCVMSLTETGITRPSDLVGQSVGMTGIPSQEAILATMLERDGASLDDIELVNIGFDLVPALVSGRVAAVMGAYWTHETLLAEREGFSVSILRVEEWGIPTYYELVLVASEQTVAERGDLVTALLTGMTRGYYDALADPAAALDALVAASPDTDRALESEGIPLSASAWLDASGRFGTQTADRWAAYGAWMIERGLIPADLDIAAAWTDALLPDLPPATPAATPTV